MKRLIQIVFVLAIMNSHIASALALPGEVSGRLDVASRLSLMQIIELIQNRTPDEAIAGEIRDRGIDFEVDANVLSDLRSKGAGAETLKALKETTSARPKAEEARRTIEKELRKKVDDDSFVQTLRDGHIEEINVFLTARQTFLRKRFSKENDKTALMIAAESGFPDVVRYLIRACENDSLQDYLEARDLDEKTALILAAASRESYSPVNAIDALIAAGANVNVKDNGGKTALVWAASQGNTSVVVRLINAGADFKPEDWLSLSPLIAAAGAGQERTVNELIRRGADKDFNNPVDGNTPLIEASIKARPKVVQLLLHEGADIRKKNTQTMQSALEMTRGSLNLWQRNKPEDIYTKRTFETIIRMLETAESR